MDNLCGLLKAETGVEIYETSSSITGSLLSPVKVRVHYQLTNGYYNLHENNEYKHYLPLYIVLSLSPFKFKHSELAEFIHTFFIQQYTKHYHTPFSFIYIASMQQFM